MARGSCSWVSRVPRVQAHHPSHRHTTGTGTHGQNAHTSQFVVTADSVATTPGGDPGLRGSLMGDAAYLAQVLWRFQGVGFAPVGRVCLGGTSLTLHAMTVSCRVHPAQRNPPPPPSPPWVCVAVVCRRGAPALIMIVGDDVRALGSHRRGCP